MVEYIVKSFILTCLLYRRKNRRKGKIDVGLDVKAK